MAFLGSFFLPIWLRLQSPYTGVSTPPSPKISKKSQKGLPGPPGPECQKSVEKVPNDPKKSQKGCKISVRGLFRHFFDTGRGRPGSPFWDFLGSSGIGGVETPVYGDRSRFANIPEKRALLFLRSDLAL